MGLFKKKEVLIEEMTDINGEAFTPEFIDEVSNNKGDEE